MPWCFDMTLTKNNDQTAVAMSNRKLTASSKTSISKDGKWKTCLGVPGLMLYIPSGQYFARVKVKGVVRRASLGTDVFSTAKDKLAGKVGELRKDPVPVGTFGDGCNKYEQETRNGYTNAKKRLVRLAPLSIVYRLRCIEDLRRSLVECLSHKSWKQLNEQARKDALARLDAS